MSPTRVTSKEKSKLVAASGDGHAHEAQPTESAVFRGNFSHALDEKGRVSLPVEFRKTLGDVGDESIVLTNYVSDGSRCLEGFGLSAWHAFEKRLRAKSRFDPKLQKLENFYLSRAGECSIDAAGRILVPSHLRQYAGLERDCTFTSSIHGFRLWDSRVWAVVFSQAEEALMSDPTIFSEVDL